MINETTFWGIIDASIDKRDNWAEQINAIAESTKALSLKDIIAFDIWLQQLILDTHITISQSIPEEFLEISDLRDSLSCWLICLGSKQYQKFLKQPPLIISR